LSSSSIFDAQGSPDIRIKRGVKSILELTDINVSMMLAGAQISLAAETMPVRIFSSLHSQGYPVHLLLQDPASLFRLEISVPIDRELKSP